MDKFEKIKVMKNISKLKKKRTNSETESLNTSSSHSLSFIQCGDGKLKRLRNKTSYKEIYLEHLNFTPNEIPFYKERNLSFININNNKNFDLNKTTNSFYSNPSRKNLKSQSFIDNIKPLTMIGKIKGKKKKKEIEKLVLNIEDDEDYKLSKEKPNKKNYTKISTIKNPVKGHKKKNNNQKQIDVQNFQIGNNINDEDDEEKNENINSKIIEKLEKLSTEINRNIENSQELQTKENEIKENKKYKFEPKKNKQKVNNNIYEDSKEIHLSNKKNQNKNKNKNQKEITIDIKIIKNVFGNTFKENGNTIKQKSLFGNIPSHKIFRCIIKTNEDLRQEQFATQLINEFYQIFKQEKVNCWLNTYEIISTGNNSGLVEMVNDSISIDQLKQKTSNLPLNDFFIYFFDKKTKPEKYKKAMNNYIKSLAGYSLLCYFLQIKDRHNGNILLDRNGHIIHIDFGFLLSNAPGKGLKFETAPFKLTKDMIDVLGGENSEYFHKFKQSIKNGFKAIINNKEKILILVEMMWCGHGKNLPCFEREQETIIELRNRLEQSDKIVEDLINQSIKSWTTTVYDYFQYYVQGINC